MEELEGGIKDLFFLGFDAPKRVSVSFFVCSSEDECKEVATDTDLVLWRTWECDSVDDEESL